MSHKTSLLIVEPSEIIVQGIRSLLADTGDFNILAPLSDAALLQDRVMVQNPDVLLLNPTLLPSPQRQQLANLQMQRPSMPIVALVYQYVEPQLLQAFRQVLDIREKGNRVVSIMEDAAAAGNEAGDTSESYELSEREVDVLVLVAKGLSSKEIADKLCISVHTVSTHRKNITRKTGIKSVAGLAVYAMLHNLT